MYINKLVVALLPPAFLCAATNLLLPPVEAAYLTGPEGPPECLDRKLPQVINLKPEQLSPRCGNSSNLLVLR